MRCLATATARVVHWMGCRRVGSATAALMVAVLAPAAQANTPGPGGIYSCTDDKGRRWTSDRPIPACHGREHRVLNPDGSVKAVLTPELTADERAEQDQRERKALLEQSTRQDALRRDRNLMLRFRNEAAHQNARNAALDDLRKAVQVSERRLAALQAERKPLTDETEFYVGKPLPAQLRQRLDANDATIAAQRSLMENQQIEIVRINAMYDIELERLKRLWAGVAPGSLGALPLVVPTVGAVSAGASAPR